MYKLFLIILLAAQSALAMETGTYSAQGNKSSIMKFEISEWGGDNYFLKGCIFHYDNICPRFEVVLEPVADEPDKYVGDGVMIDHYQNNKDCNYAISVKAYYEENSNGKDALYMSVYSPDSVSPKWNPSCPATFSWFNIQEPYYKIN